MTHSRVHRSIEALLTFLSAESAAGAVPPAIDQEARRATLRTFEREVWTQRTAARAAAYYRTVVKRTLVRSRSNGEATARLVLASVEADLRAVGKDPRGVWEEIERGWSGKVPGGVLEEYRSRLCA